MFLCCLSLSSLGKSVVLNQMQAVVLKAASVRWPTDWEAARTSLWRWTTCWSARRSTTCLESSKDSLIPVKLTFLSPLIICSRIIFSSLYVNICVYVFMCESADRYVVLGAQRDAWGNGYARATVGTSVLIELAKAVHKMVENGNKYYILHTEYSQH